MSFSIRRMFSNIYFKKTEEVPSSTNKPNADEQSHFSTDFSQNVSFERLEPDSTSKQCATSLKLPESVRKLGKKKGSHSDTDVISIDSFSTKEKRKCSKLKGNVKGANSSSALDIPKYDNSLKFEENTPKRVLLESGSDFLSERLKNIDFDKSFDLYDYMSDNDDLTSSSEGKVDVESFSEQSQSDISVISDEGQVCIKMCRKVDKDLCDDSKMVRPTSIDSFGDLELDDSEEGRAELLLKYKEKLEKLDSSLSKTLSELKFHIEVSKIFHTRSVVSALYNGTPAINYEKVSRGVSPVKSNWNVIMEKEDKSTIDKFRKQLLLMKDEIEDFISSYMPEVLNKRVKSTRSVTYNIVKENSSPRRRFHINDKKKYKHFDFPDLRDVMSFLFEPEIQNQNGISTNIMNTNISESDESDNFKCECRCHAKSPSGSDSGITSKSSEYNMSVNSVIGNFSLDNMTLSMYSEYLEQSFNCDCSFQALSMYSAVLQKSAMERLTFYIQVHSIQLNTEHVEDEYESRNILTFFCMPCKEGFTHEKNLLTHTLSQDHCEKVHFLYKTAYVRKCIDDGKEIQPSTVLNPMTMYRDENKIICFGNAVYACSLCFENMIVGESVLMSHCHDPDHVERRKNFHEMFI